MHDLTNEALPPQELYDLVQQVLDGPDATKLSEGILQMLYKAKARALRNGAMASSTDEDEEIAKRLTVGEIVANVINDVVESLLSSHVKALKDKTVLIRIVLSDICSGLFVLTTCAYPLPSLKKNLLTESFKWARAPPVRDKI